MGIPVICNSGVGDVEQIVKKADAGFVVDGFSAEAFDKAIRSISILVGRSPSSIRDAIAPIYSLKKGVELYAKCYRSLLS